MPKMMRKFFLFFTLILFPLGVFGQSSDVKFTEFDLENGLHVILHEDNSTPIIAITVTYHVGSKNEQPNRTGFAHFFEHLMFEGSENIKRGEYDTYVQNAGGQLNASTSFDQTFYYETLPSNQAELGLWLESERMLHLKVDSIGVETQRGVVKEERRQGLENRPYGSIMEQTFSHAFKEHPYRWTPIGSAQYIDMATLDEFMQFYKTFYVPNNAVLSIAGDFKTDEMKKLIGKYFGDIPKGTNEIYRPNVIEPAQTAEVRDTVFDNIQLPAVIQAYHIPKQGTDDYYALQMLTILLSGGQSSRLYKKLVDEERKALQVASFPFSLEDPGLFLVLAITNAGVTADEVEALIDGEIQNAKTKLVDEKEFEKLRNQVESDFYSQNSTVLGKARNLAEYELFFGDANLINTEIERYLKVTREDVKNAANKYLTKENRTVLYYLPKSASK
jgi:predicted Zn-dependent peptidase